MRLILANAIINMDRIVSTYIETDGTLRLDCNDAAYIVRNIPENALQQIAVAYAQGKTFLEFDTAILSLEEDDGNQQTD